MTKKLLSLILLAICGAGSNSLASDLQWFGAAGDRDWSNTANWGPSGGPIPTGINGVKISCIPGNAPAEPIINARGAVAKEIYISEDRNVYSDWIYESSLTIAAGGELTVNGQVLLGYFWLDPHAGLPANDGSLIIDDGMVNVGTDLLVGFGGNGHLVVNSGTLNVGGRFAIGCNGGGGSINLNGGVLNTEAWNFANASSYIVWENGEFHAYEYAYYFDIAGGEWIQNHNYVNDIQALVDAGRITGYGLTGNVSVTWDPVLDQTHVKAIPEPVSIVMLGAGALSLFRGKRNN